MDFYPAGISNQKMGTMWSKMNGHDQQCSAGKTGLKVCQEDILRIITPPAA